MNATFKDFLYYRYIIQKCVELNKVLLLSCDFNGICSNDETKFTFIKITPYLPDNYVTSIIADHINLNKENCLKYIPLNSFNKGKRFIIVGKPYIYTNRNGDIKGGLVLSNELEKFGIKPINHLTTKYLKCIPYNYIIDFRKEFNGIYGWKKQSIGDIKLSSEQKMIKKENFDSDKFSFTINYSENLYNSDNNISIQSNDDIEEKIINDDKNENETFLFNIIDSNKNVNKKLKGKRIVLKKNNILLELIKQEKIRNIDDNLQEFSSSIKVPPILLQRLPNGLHIPPCRRK